MHELNFIQDLAVIMIIAGLITILFHRMKQPVVLGYIVAGILIGPYTPPFQLIHDQTSIKLLAELGMVFLMFSLGLEFSFRHLSKVGFAAFITATSEIFVMIVIGYGIGHLFNWSASDSLFLGAILAISSTTIIVKALNDLGLRKEKFVQLIFGILIVEDILGIGMLVLLSSIANSKALDVLDAIGTMGKLLLFLIVTFVLGILIVPRLLAYVAKYKSNEMLLVSTLGLCFGCCLLVIKLNYSIVLGAFLMGAIIAETTQLKLIERLIEPLRDMFSAIFFVTIGLLLDPRMLITYAVPIIVITLALIIGKTFICSLGVFLTGRGGRTALRTGMSLAQIGELSFIIASLGTSLQVTSQFLYPIAVAVSVITTMLTPYLIKAADPLTHYFAHKLPFRIVYIFNFYTSWLQNLQVTRTPTEIIKVVRRSLFQIFVNLAMVAAIFITMSYFGPRGMQFLWSSVPIRILTTLTWGSALIIALPFLIAIYRKTKALSMLLAEISISRDRMGRFTEHMRKIISELIPVIVMIVIMIFICALSISILPYGELLLFVLCVVAAIATFLWRWFIKLHSRLQISLMETIEKEKNETK